jgi:phage/plasmid-associated DNA primase
LVNEIDVMANSMEPLKTDAFYEMADASANSISKYFKEFLDKDVIVLMADGFEHKKDYLEIPLSALYSMYKDWCADTGHNRMQSSNIVSYIKDGNINKVVYKIDKGNCLIHVTV